ncbi:MAG: 4-alpha-glucanotransferase [Christensenella sp.]|nr:4-alpha-glucanotransferase [Christensenella sp.]
MKRGSGILLHITSLPSPYGIGTLGRAAFDFVNALAEAKQRYWQMLPVPPTGSTNCPYQGLSAFAINPYFIDMAGLMEDGLIHADDLLPLTQAGESGVRFDGKFKFRTSILRKAYQNGKNKYRDEFAEYQYQNAEWLFDYSLFSAIRESFSCMPSVKWDKAFLSRKEGALVDFAKTHSEEVMSARFSQFLSEKQWKALKQYANERGIQLIGDIPIYVSQDSADVWAHPEMFLRGGAVAGTPPDYFNKNGQRWDNPLYDWEDMKQTGYRWWISRLRRSFELFDVVRIDHFRGFESFYAIPAGGKPKDGQWIKGPGKELFDAIDSALPHAKIIAEDLGMITPEVRDLLVQCDFPGSKVLQFAFDSENSIYLPHCYPRNCVVYTGTHDNNTSRAWFRTLAPENKQRLFCYLGKECTEQEAANWLIRLAMGSVADICVIPMQDVLNLGSRSRMNFPGKAKGYWEWRMRKGAFGKKQIGYLAELADCFGRS